MDWVAVDKCMLSRLLYPNPVCLLSVRSSDDGNDRSLMTVTWITPINNHGGFICSINMNRHTAKFINQTGAIFVLNVPVRGMEELVLAIGSCTGAEVDKLKQFDIAVCAPGGGIFSNEAPTDQAPIKKQKLSKKDLARQEIAHVAQQTVALRDCVVHLLCRVESVTEDDGHRLLRCSQLAAWTRRAYWNGRNFIVQDGTNAEPYLTFLGSKVFGYVIPGDLC